jgi:phage shock protein A
MESVFNAYEHTVAALEQELAGLQKDIETLQARVSEADGTNTIGPDEIQSELQTVNARVSSAVDSLNRLRETQ